LNSQQPLAADLSSFRQYDTRREARAVALLKRLLRSMASSSSVVLTSTLLYTAQSQIHPWVALTRPETPQKWRFSLKLSRATFRSWQFAEDSNSSTWFSAGPCSNTSQTSSATMSTSPVMASTPLAQFPVCQEPGPLQSLVSTLSCSVRIIKPSIDLAKVSSSQLLPSKRTEQPP